MGIEDDELKRNYEELHESTGESYESIAARVEENDSKELAAWLRSKHAGEADQTREEKPKARRSGKGSVAAAEAATETAADSEAETTDTATETAEGE